MKETYDIAIIGAGISGFSSALRLQKKGYKTVVLEAHGQLGGCAGFFRKKGFAFDVGATTLVDFVEGGVGGNFFKEIGLALPKGEYLDYLAWLPDRQITLFRDRKRWAEERLKKLGASEKHRKFWKLFDKVTDVFWKASRKNIKLPIQNVTDMVDSVQAIGIKNLLLGRYIYVSMWDVLKKYGLEQDKPLKGLLSMLIEDTVHSTLEKAPFINAALGTTIRGAGLMRMEGGMKGLWEYLSRHYLSLGGTIKKGNRVQGCWKTNDHWHIQTNKKVYQAQKIVCSLPLDLTLSISPTHIKTKISSYYKQNEAFKGGAIVVFLGVPESEVAHQPLTHHQLLIDYDAPLGNGNNMFISVSHPSDNLSAPDGFRAVMISTHCELEDWQNLSKEAYRVKKEAIGAQLVKYARQVYPQLGNHAVVYEVGTPLTYEKYTHRVGGAVGGFKQSLANSNLKAVPQYIGFEDFFLVGDNTWPGLGTVAGLMSSSILMRYL